MDIKNASTNLRALVADDSVVTQRLISIVLEQMEIAADFTDNGNQALDQVKSVNYDIVFLDVVMPGLDGYQVCKRIKSNKSSKDIPVIMLTGKDGTFDKIRGKMAGANRYLTKPVDTTEFIAVLKQFLPLYHLKTDPDLGRLEDLTPPVKQQATRSALDLGLLAEAPSNNIRPDQKTSSNTQLSHAEKIVKIRKMLEK